MHGSHPAGVMGDMSATTTLPVSAYHRAVEKILLGPDAEHVVAAAVATRGRALDSWALRDVHARPGAETSAGYDVIASGVAMYLVASSVELTDEECLANGVVRLESPVGTVHVWEHPNDPTLTGLRKACSSGALQSVLTHALHEEVVVTGLDMLVYRPMRRSVVRAELATATGPRVVYIKVVRPSKAHEVAQRHALFEGNGAPECVELGSGLVMLSEAHGTPLARHLLSRSTDAQHLIDPRLLVERLETLPQSGAAFSARAPAPAKVKRYTQGAIKQGRDARRVLELADQIAVVIRDTPVGPFTVTHGDYNVANIFVDASGPTPRLAGLIDLDTLGPGHLIDDLACLMAHIAVLPGISREKYAAVPQYLERLFEVCDTKVDAAGLRARAAANVLSLVSGCPDQERAESWLEAAHDLAAGASTLMRTSSSGSPATLM